MRRKSIISAGESAKDFFARMILHKIYSKVVLNCITIRTHLLYRILSTTYQTHEPREELPWKIALLFNPRCWSCHSFPIYIWRCSFSSTPAVSRSFTWYVTYFSPLYSPALPQFTLFNLRSSLFSPFIPFLPFSHFYSLCLHRSSWTATRRA